jgi:hypothetical protein
MELVGGCGASHRCIRLDANVVPRTAAELLPQGRLVIEATTAADIEHSRTGPACFDIEQHHVAKNQCAPCARLEPLDEVRPRKRPYPYLVGLANWQGSELSVAVVDNSAAALEPEWVRLLAGGKARTDALSGLRLTRWELSSNVSPNDYNKITSED